MTYKPTNLNHHIKVKITDDGFRHMSNYYNQYTLKAIDRCLPEWYKNRVDNDGFYTMQIHEWMAVFQSINPMSLYKYFEMNVQIEVE